MQELTKTQAFKTLLDRTYKCFQERNETAFFIEGVKLYETGGEKALEGEIKKVYDRIISNYKNVLCIDIAYNHQLNNSH